MRERAKDSFPTVLLTLLSIVQALALELLWSHIMNTAYLFEMTWLAAISWVQITATFLGLVLIWVVYASNVMRFRWTPVTSDSVYPFVIGLIEFAHIASLDADEISNWLLLMALIFSTMTWVSHTNMKRARRDPDNASFFANRQPATLRDFYVTIAITLALITTGIIFRGNDAPGAGTMIVLLATNALLIAQFYSVARFWEQSMDYAKETDAEDSVGDK